MLPAHYTLRKSILTLVVRAVYKRTGAHDGEINDIAHQRNEQEHKEIRDPCEFSISSAFFAFLRVLCLGDFFEFRPALRRLSGLSGRCSSQAIS